MKQTKNSWQNESAKCTKKCSYQNNAYEVTSTGVVCCRDRVLVKTSTDWQTEMLNGSKFEVLGAYTLLRRFSKPPGAKRPSAWLSSIFWKIGFHYNDRSNPAEEIGILEFL